MVAQEQRDNSKDDTGLRIFVANCIAWPLFLSTIGYIPCRDYHGCYLHLGRRFLARFAVDFPALRTAWWAAFTSICGPPFTVDKFLSLVFRPFDRVLRTVASTLATTIGSVFDAVSGIAKPFISKTTDSASARGSRMRSRFFNQSHLQKICVVVAVTAPFMMPRKWEYLTWGRFDDASELLGVWVACIAVWLFWGSSGGTEADD